MRTVTSERGAIGPFVIGIFLAIVAATGLVVDGGAALNARQRLSDAAEQAARYGANQIDLNRLRIDGAVVIDTAAADAAARSFLDAGDYDDVDVQVGPDAVTVTVTQTVDTQLIMIVPSFEVEGRATARAAVGIVGEIP